MSNPWRKRSDSIWEWSSPFGKVWLMHVGTRFQATIPGGERVSLVATDVAAGFREVERIIAERCRETLSQMESE